MSSLFKKILKIAPIAAAFIPGIGPLAAAGIGAASGALGGGGLKGALLGAASGAGGKLLGSGSSGFLGSAAGKLGAGGMGPPTPGSGILGALTKGGSGLSSLTGAGTGGLKSLLSPASTIFSGVQSYGAQGDMEDQLKKQQRRSEALLSPYNQTGLAANKSLSERLSAGFNPGDLANDPGYQFRLGQGEKSMNRSLGAQGSLFSGKAIKAGQEYGQGFAKSEYQDAYDRWQAQNQQLAGQAGQGLQSAGATTGVYDNLGNISANATLGKSNVMNSTLSQLLSGSGKRNIVGYKADGTPIYDEELEDA